MGKLDDWAIDFITNWNLAVGAVKDGGWNQPAVVHCLRLWGQRYHAEEIPLMQELLMGNTIGERGPAEQVTAHLKELGVAVIKKVVVQYYVNPQQEEVKWM
jgi:hypothetical protein